jgi:hypothetical protein
MKLAPMIGCPETSRTKRSGGDTKTSFPKYTTPCAGARLAENAQAIAKSPTTKLVTLLRSAVLQKQSRMNGDCDVIFIVMIRFVIKPDRICGSRRRIVIHAHLFRRHRQRKKLTLMANSAHVFGSGTKLKDWRPSKGCGGTPVAIISPPRA